MQKIKQGVKPHLIKNEKKAVDESNVKLDHVDKSISLQEALAKEPVPFRNYKKNNKDNQGNTLSPGEAVKF